MIFTKPKKILTSFLCSCIKRRLYFKLLQHASDLPGSKYCTNLPLSITENRIKIRGVDLKNLTEKTDKSKQLLRLYHFEISFQAAKKKISKACIKKL